VKAVTRALKMGRVVVMVVVCWERDQKGMGAVGRAWGRRVMVVSGVAGRSAWEDGSMGRLADVVWAGRRRTGAAQCAGRSLSCAVVGCWPGLVCDAS